MPLSRLCAAIWLLLALVDMTLGEMAPGSQCGSDQSWSSDLGKCQKCVICRHQPKNDFCTSCSPDLPAKNTWLWPIVGSAVGAFTLVLAISAFLVVRRCKKKQQFTTPIEETGGHSAEDALIH